MLGRTVLIPLETITTFLVDSQLEKRFINVLEGRKAAGVDREKSCVIICSNGNWILNRMGRGDESNTKETGMCASVESSWSLGCE